VLDDAPPFIAEGGQLPSALADAGIAPGDVTMVFLTHLHPDHIGWVAPGGTLYFPNAVVVYGEADWDALIAPAPADDPGRVGLEAAKAAGILRAISEPMVELAPGVTAHHTPGHTPGHYAVRVYSQGADAYVLGDAVQHPLQLADDGISFLSDADADAALATRENLFRTLETQGSPAGMQHFPGLNFLKVSKEGGRSWTEA
jgi:glyoxylase-like metal-dependent hydrolase (beta-lactamase superfamily II)